jgi:hypothetical protein
VRKKYWHIIGMDIIALDDEAYEIISKLMDFVQDYDDKIHRITMGFIKPKPDEREEFILKYINDNGLTDRVLIVVKSD